MSKSLCSKDLYCTFLKVTSQRYSALSLSEVAPYEISHDSISRWIESAHCRPKDIWNEARSHVLGSDGIIVADETVLNKSRSQKIELVRWQYSGDEHDIIRGSPSKNDVVSLVRKRWQIEVFHRELKQTCGLEFSQSRTSRSQRNHIMLSVLSWIRKADVRRKYNLTLYQQKWSTIKSAISHQLAYELSTT